MVVLQLSYYRFIAAFYGFIGKFSRILIAENRLEAVQLVE